MIMAFDPSHGVGDAGGKNFRRELLDWKKGIMASKECSSVVEKSLLQTLGGFGDISSKFIWVQVFGKFPSKSRKWNLRRNPGSAPLEVHLLGSLQILK